MLHVYSCYPLFFEIDVAIELCSFHCLKKMELERVYRRQNVTIDLGSKIVRDFWNVRRRNSIGPPAAVTTNLNPIIFLF
jgi:hypothetical protein